MSGDHIVNTGHGGTIISKSAFDQASNRIHETGGDASAAALRELSAFVEASHNRAASEHMTLLIEALAEQNARPERVGTHWSNVVAALPAIMQLPAAITFVANLFQR